MLGKKLNDFLNTLRRQYPGEIFYLNNCDDHYEILMTNRALIKDKSFEDYFFKLSCEIFGEEAYKIYTSLDYLNEIPEKELNDRINILKKSYIIKNNDLKVSENKKAEEIFFVKLNDLKNETYKSISKANIRFDQIKSNKKYDDNKLLEVAWWLTN